MDVRTERLASDALRLERLLPGPMERVWSFLTESEKRGRWLASGEWELRPGGRIELHFAHDRLQHEPTPSPYRDMPMNFTGTVLRCEPPKLIAFTWVESNGEPSEVTFELEPRGEQVALIVSHRRIASRAELLDIAGGWDVHTGILEDILESRPPRAFWSTHERLLQEYSRRFAE
jgi:uncharacterized protein YndB with AHSA1/START domain